MALAPKDFAALGILKRLQLIKSEGRFLASRTYAGFNVHLYAVHQHYCEVWIRMGFSQVQWIEIASKDLVIDNYVVDSDFQSALGI